MKFIIINIDAFVMNANAQRTIKRLHRMNALIVLSYSKHLPRLSLKPNVQALDHEYDVTRRQLRLTYVARHSNQ